jgi:hypothetical protein
MAKAAVAGLPGSPNAARQGEMIHSRISLSGSTWGRLWPVTRGLPIIALLFFALPFLRASSTGSVTGSYTVLEHRARGPQAQIRMRIHLVNSGPSDLFIRRMILSNLSHPDGGTARACAVTIRAHSWLETTQEFTVSRSEYQLWRRGMKPRFLLQVGSPGGSVGRASQKSMAVVLENRTSSQEAQ